MGSMISYARQTVPTFLYLVMRLENFALQELLLNMGQSKLLFHPSCTYAAIYLGFICSPSSGVSLPFFSLVDIYNLYTLLTISIRFHYHRFLK